MPNKPSTFNNTIALILIALTVFFTGAAIYLSMRSYSQQAKANQVVTVDLAALAPVSSVGEGSSTAEFSLYSESGYLYKSDGNGLGAVVDFISKDPQVVNDNVQGVSTIQKKKIIKTPQKILPANFLSHSYLARKKDDKNDSFLKKQGFNVSGEHYYFRQKIGNVPLYKASLAVHLKNDKEVYAVSGNMSLSDQVKQQILSKKAAADIALAKANSLAPTLKLKILQQEDYVFNYKILGLSDDESNYPALAVTIVSNGKLPTFAKRYFVSLYDGAVLYVEELKESAVDRAIYDCDGGTTTCTLARLEGEAATGTKDIDDTYTYLGDAYTYFSQTFQRDSYDNQGSPLEAFVNLTTQIDCPNAFWSKAPSNIFAICKNMAGKDVIAHEYTHAITEHTADLLSTNQTGAVNEAMSDIFAYAVEPSNWTVGEGTALGVIRNGDDPGKDPPNTGGPHPDRLFSTRYFCGTSDDGGVHQNMTIPVKAFYLMTVGGSFNGCTINAIGRTTAHAIFYRALTTYMSATSNFRGVYNTMLQSCSDLFANNPSVCAEVKKALQAVEMDQQPVSSQTGASCSNIQRQVPECASQSPSSTPAGPTTVPTSGPSPTPTVGPSPTPTTAPTSGPSSTPPANPTATPTSAPVATSTPRPTSTPRATPTRPPITADSIVLHMRLKFQGILIQPSVLFNDMDVHVGIKHTGDPTAAFADGDFTADANGVWKGDVVINGVTPGDDFFVYVKGPKHIQKKICVNTPVETYVGSYTCGDSGSIRLTKGDNAINFSGVSLLSGDLPEQDGLANSYDLSSVRNLLGSTDPEALRQADVNLDGIVDTQDYSLILNSLAFRFDESPE